MGLGPNLSSRHKLTYRAVSGESVILDGLPARVVLSRNKISVGCTDAEPAVLRELLRLHEGEFGKDTEIVVQTGMHPC